MQEVSPSCKRSSDVYLQEEEDENLGLKEEGGVVRVAEKPACFQLRGD